MFSGKIKADGNRVDVLKLKKQIIHPIWEDILQKQIKLQGDPIAFWMDETKFVHDLQNLKRQLSKHSISKASSINCKTMLTTMI
jgi:hypothetical protein